MVLRKAKPKLAVNRNILPQRAGSEDNSALIYNFALKIGFFQAMKASFCSFFMAGNTKSVENNLV
jgi:hypothetical protein